MVMAGLVTYGLGLNTWFFLLAAASIPSIIVGAVMARDVFRRLEQEFSGSRVEEIRSAAVIATFGDLIRRRPSRPLQ